MPHIVPVSNADDPRIAPYRDIRERDLVGRQGRFIAEGLVVVRMLLAQSRHRPLSLLIAERRLASVLPLLETHPGLPVYVAPDAVLSEVAGFNMHRGILGLGQRGDETQSAVPIPRSGSPLLVLIGIANHDNMGGIFRNAAAFAAAGILIDSACCDPLYRKSIRVSAGTALMLPFLRLAAGDDPIAIVAAAGYRPIALTPRGSTDLTRFVPPSHSALFFGSEGTGLPEHILDQCIPVSIPMASGIDSLNVATASGIVLHHFANRT